MNVTYLQTPSHAKAGPHPKPGQSRQNLCAGYSAFAPGGDMFCSVGVHRRDPVPQHDPCLHWLTVYIGEERHEYVAVSPPFATHVLTESAVRVSQQDFDCGWYIHSDRDSQACISCFFTRSQVGSDMLNHR